MDNLMNIIKRLHMTKDEVIQEAELVEETGEYLHISLIGYCPETLREAASKM